MVISAVRRSKQPSRTEIAAATGLSHSTISSIASDLIAEGILLEAKTIEGTPLKRGRPQVGLALDPAAGAVITVVLSINFLSVSLMDYAGGTIAQEERKLATRDLSADELIAQCADLVRRQLGLGGLASLRVLRIVLAVQGTTDADCRLMLWSPIATPVRIGFADGLEKAFGIPVTVENDCNMIAFALRWRDPVRYAHDFIAILLSYGIGMGLVLRGELFTGTHSSGGEFGHMIHEPDGALCRCGRRGCVEAYAGNYAIWRNAKGLSEASALLDDISDDDMIALACAARDRDGAERQAFAKAGEALGFALGSLFALIDPAPVAFVGIGTVAFDLIEPSLRAAIARTAGGQHADAISLATIEDELPLIREGAAMRGLTFVDEEIFAPAHHVPRQFTPR